MASRGVNKVILIGNLGQDPDVKYTASGAAVTNISVATSEQWTDKQSGQKQERTEWHRVVFFGKLAEIAGQYLKKGSKVYIEGALRTRKWQGQDGQDRYTTEVVVDINGQMQMLDGPGWQDQSPQGQYQHPSPPPQPQMPPSQPGRVQPMQQPQYQQPAPQPQQAPMQPPQPTPGSFDNFDDDIPW